MNPPEAPLLVLTNDDGVDAPGLAALKAAVAGLGRRRVIAPDGPCSGCGHRVTTHEPVVVAARGEDEFVVAGTPVDCVRLALHHLAPEAAWVVSGINAGGNLGTDVYHSGTVAAVREAAIHGRPGVAVSQYLARGKPVDWARAGRWTRRVLIDLLGSPPGPGAFWNVNLPHDEPDGPEPAVVFCPLDPSPLPLHYEVIGAAAHYRGDYHQRPRRPSCDVEVCFGGRISVTLVRLSTVPEIAAEA